MTQHTLAESLHYEIKQALTREEGLRSALKYILETEHREWDFSLLETVYDIARHALKEFPDPEENRLAK